MITQRIQLLVLTAAAACAGAGCADYWLGDGPGATAAVTTPSGTLTGDVAIAYTLTGDAGATDISVSYSTDGRTFRPATEGAGSGGTVGLAVAPEGATHTYVWASGLDLEGERLSTVYVRVSPSGGDSDTAGPMRVHNARFLAAVEDVASGAPGKVRLYSIDATSGSLAFLQSVGTGGTGSWDAMYHEGFFLVANQDSNTISVLQLQPDTRILLPVAGSPFSAGIAGPRYLATDGGFVFASGSNAVGMLEFRSDTGALSFESNVAVTAPRAMVVRSAYLYIASETADSIEIHDIDGRGWLLLNGYSPIGTGAGSLPRALLLAGTRVYAAGASSAAISGFNVLGGGNLSALAGSPFATSGAAGEQLALNGSKVFAVSGSTGRLVSATLDAFGNLTEDAASPVALGGPSWTVATAGEVVVAATTTSKTLEVFTIEGGGTLSAAVGSPHAAGVGIRRLAISD